MSKLNVVKRCINCGAILQDTDPKAPGYISPEIFENDARAMFCNKCYAEDQYNLVPHKITIDPDFDIILQDARATDALIVYVIDLFSFEASFSPEVTKKLKGRRVLAIATKRDLLPDTVSDEYLKEDVAHRLRVENLHVDDVILTSCTMELNIKEIITKIEKMRERHDVYLIGAVGAGKTTLINTLLKNFKNTSNRTIKTAEYPGTNIRVMQIPLDRSTTMFDTEGLSIENSMISHVEPEVARAIVPLKTVEARKFRLTPESYLFVGGLARFDFVSGPGTDVSCYFAKKVGLRRTVTKKADELFIKYMNTNALDPHSNHLNSLTDFNVYEIVVDEKGERDIGIQGLGWISFTGDKQVIRVAAPKGVSVYYGRAKVKEDADK